MDGPEIVKFTLEVVPPMIERVLESASWTRDDVRTLSHAPGHVLHARSSPRAAGLERRARPAGAEGLRQHGLVDLADVDARPACGRPPDARHADACSSVLAWGCRGRAARGRRPGSRGPPPLPRRSDACSMRIPARTAANMRTPFSKAGIRWTRPRRRSVAGSSSGISSVARRPHRACSVGELD